MSKRGRKRRGESVWRRRTGVIYRPPILGAPTLPGRIFRYSNDGGDDAPLTSRGRVVFWTALGVVIILGTSIIVWTRG